MAGRQNPDAVGHGAWGDHRGVPGGPAEPQRECAEGCLVPEVGATLWVGSLATGGVPQRATDVLLEPGANWLRPSRFL